MEVRAYFDCRRAMIFSILEDIFAWVACRIEKVMLGGVIIEFGTFDAKSSTGGLL